MTSPEAWAWQASSSVCGVLAISGLLCRESHTTAQVLWVLPPPEEMGPHRVLSCPLPLTWATLSPCAVWG